MVPNNYGIVDLNKLPELRLAEGYQYWLEAMITHLRAQGVQRYTDRTIIKLAPISTSGVVAQNEYQTLFYKWMDGDEKAICWLLSLLICYEIMKFGSAKEVWDELKKKYDVVSSV